MAIAGAVIVGGDSGRSGWLDARPISAPPTVTRLWLKLSEEEQQLPNAGRQIIAI